MYTRPATMIWWTVTAAAAVLAGIVLVLALTRDAPEVAVEEPTPPATPSDDEPAPPDPPGPVTGAVELIDVTDLDVTGSGLRPDGSSADAPTPIDDAAVEAAAEATATLLDGLLTAAQDGDADVLPAALEGPRDAITTGLTDPTRPVVAATYRLNIGVRGVPEWIRADVHVEREDGSSGHATFVLIPGGEELELVAVHAGSGAEPPAADPAASTDAPEEPS